MSLRDDILAVDDRNREEVDLTAEWGCKLYARMMTVDEYAAWLDTPAEFRRAAYVINSTVDAEDTKVFRAGEWKESTTVADGKESTTRTFEPGDEPALSKKGHRAMHKLMMAANRVNKGDVKED